MNSFTLSVGGIERREYFEACRESARRLHAILAASMVVICGALMLLQGRVSLADFLGPAAVYIVVTGGYALMTRLGYRDQLAVIDPPVRYEFGGEGWSVTSEGGKAEFAWRETPKLRRTRSCLFLYNDGASSNLLPLRLMTDDEVKALEAWFAASRAEYKVYQKESDAAARQKFREEHPGLRLGRTGPAWGPWKKQ